MALVRAGAPGVYAWGGPAANAHVYCQNLDVWWEMLQPVRVDREVEFIPSKQGVLEFKGKGFKAVNYKAPIYSAKVVVV